MKVGFVSLGCPKNLVDSEVMLGLAQKEGHELTADAAQADVVVVNTCAFIDRAKQESIDAILEMAELKKAGSCKRLVVTGCLGERYRDELKKEIPEIDAVLGTSEVPDIVDAISGQRADVASVTFYRNSDSTSITYWRVGPHPHSRTDADAPSLALGRVAAGAARSLPTYIYDAETPRVLTTPNHYAYIKIAEGCDYKCAFCIIPTLRGAYRSRPAESIVREARDLAARGVREILLVSQDTTFYGIDRGERGALAALLRQLNAIDGLAWIRLLYLYPTTIDDETIAAIADCANVCKYIDLPLQHASDAVLRRMKRPGTRRGYTRLLARIRERIPTVTLRTTFIVGFPGETEADVDELCAFVNEIGFDHVGVFTYSHEEGTSAFDVDDDVPAAVKKKRQRRVMALQRSLVRRRQRARMGSRARVIIDGTAPDHELVVRGRLEGQAPDIDSAVFLTDCDPTSFGQGDVVEVEIVGSREYDLIARPLLSDVAAGL